MKTSPEGRKFIERFEGCILHAYDDATDHIVPNGGHCLGTLTIGFGHTDAAGPPRVHPGMVITSEDADSILSADLAHVEADVSRLVRVELNQPQFDALVSFHFNTGWLTHPHCSLLRDINDGKLALVESDFGLYDRASGKVERGLVHRRAAEARLFREGVYG